MSKTILSSFVATLFVVYIVGAIAYIWYHAYRIAKTAVGIEESNAFFPIDASQPILEDS
jgi:hypothetical protein